jgi:hypothetical protein
MNTLRRSFVERYVTILLQGIAATHLTVLKKWNGEANVQEYEENTDLHGSIF